MLVPKHVINVRCRLLLLQVLLLCNTPYIANWAIHLICYMFTSYLFRCIQFNILYHRHLIVLCSMSHFALHYFVSIRMHLLKQFQTRHSLFLLGFWPPMYLHLSQLNIDILISSPHGTRMVWLVPGEQSVFRQASQVSNFKREYFHLYVV